MNKNSLFIPILASSLLFSNPNFLLSKNFNQNYTQKDRLELTYKYKINQNLSNDYEKLLDSPIKTLSLNQLRDGMTYHLNFIRKQHGLNPLVLNTKVNNVCHLYSKYLFENWRDNIIDYDDHFDENWKEVLYRVRQAKIGINEDCWWDCKKVWENLITSNLSIREAFSLWMGSPDHMENILCPYFNAWWVSSYPWSNNIVTVFVNLK